MNSVSKLLYDPSVCSLIRWKRNGESLISRLLLKVNCWYFWWRFLYQWKFSLWFICSLVCQAFYKIIKINSTKFIFKKRHIKVSWFFFLPIECIHTWFLFNLENNDYYKSLDNFFFIFQRSWEILTPVSTPPPLCRNSGLFRSSPPKWRRRFCRHIRSSRGGLRLRQSRNI